jgi:integrase
VEVDGSARQRERGHVRRRGNSLQVLVYAGVDPLTGRDRYLTETVRIEPGKDGERRARQQAAKIRTRLLADVDGARAARTSTTLERAVTAWLGIVELETSTRLGYQGYIDRYVLPALGTTPIKDITVQTLDEYYASLRRCRARCSGRPHVEHRKDGQHDCKDARCTSHRCRPLAASTVRQIHSIISASLANAVRWGWIPSNPAQLARKPALPHPEPNPPNSKNAARIVTTAFAVDPAWGTLVWLAMVTGIRRGELLALRWDDVDFDSATIAIRKAYFAGKGAKLEKATKTHQMRRAAVDATTTALLKAHMRRCADRASELGLAISPETYVFSPATGHDKPYYPDAVSRRYRRMVQGLGLDTHLHALRHYNATELLRNGVDLTTVAGRLGHGAGTTTLRVYAAFVPESDKRAATLIAGQMPAIAPHGGPP